MRKRDDAHDNSDAYDNNDACDNNDAHDNNDARDNNDVCESGCVATTVGHLCLEAEPSASVFAPSAFLFSGRASEVAAPAPVGCVLPLYSPLNTPGRLENLYLAHVLALQHMCVAVSTGPPTPLPWRCGADAATINICSAHALCKRFSRRRRERR